MGKKKRSNDRTVIRRELSIGAIDAENDDDYLFECFIYLPMYAQLNDFDNSKVILLGRAGAGKTAIVRNIENKYDNVTRIEPINMALEYVANSTIVRFLEDNGVDMNLFYQVLWKHVICLEIIRRRFRITSTEEGRTFFQKMYDFVVRDQNKKNAIEYLREWDSKLWVTMDENIKGVTQKFENDISASLKAKMPGIESAIAAGNKLTEEIRTQIQIRGREIVSSTQLAKLSQIIEVLRDFAFSDNQTVHYLLIDGLDDKWVDDTIKFKLVRALIESLKAFRRIRHLKVIAAIRTDVMERALQETKHVGLQREKYEDLISEIRWSETELKSFANERIKLLFKRQYTKENVYFEDLFPYNVGKQTAFRYMLARTFMRPRDVIAFVNAALAASENQTEVTVKTFRRAEGVYSRKRLAALEEEWLSVYPSLPQLTESLHQKPSIFSFEEFSAKENIEYLALSILENQNAPKSPIYDAAQSVMKDATLGSLVNLGKKTVEALYRVGCVGVRYEKGEPFRYSYCDEPVLNVASLSNTTRLRIHPMLDRALNAKLAEDDGE